MKELRLVAPMHHNSGYAKAGRALLAAAIAAGYSVEAVETDLDSGRSVFIDGRVENWHAPKFRKTHRPAVQEAELRQALSNKVSKDAPTLILQPPHGLSNFPEYCNGPRIGLTMLEADVLNPLWANAARNVDLLLAPSPWNVETLSRDVPGVCTDLLPLCVDERLWSPDGPKREILFNKTRPDFLFCSVFSTSERKGWRALIQAFSEEFVGESVGLVVKPGRVAEVNELAEWACERGAWVEVLDEELTDEEMAEFYRGSDCFVLPSAEGFGLTFVEAMMCGLPVIGLDKGGTEQIVSEENGYPIPSSMVPCVGQLPQIYRSDHRWPAAAVGDIRTAMRAMVDNGPLNEVDRSIQSCHASAEWGRAAIGDRLDQVLSNLSTENAVVAPMYAALSTSSPDEAGSMADEPTVSGYSRQPVTFGEPVSLPSGVAVITTHNHLEATKRCVASLREHSPYLGIVFADDHSTDGTLEWAKENGLAWLSGSVSGNVSATREDVLEAWRRTSQGRDWLPYIAFLDNDVEVTAGWWERLTGIMAANAGIGILAPRKVLKSTGETQNVGNKLRLDGNSYPLMLRRPLVWCDYVETACCVIRPEVWMSVHFDPQFPIFYEDADYCFAARAAGWEIAATANVSVIHDAHTTSRTREGEGNPRRRQFIRKWRDVL